jgi:hypothetical protein
MDMRQLQARLTEHGCYAGSIDGLYGPATRRAVIQALTNGPDHALTDEDAAAAAERLGVEPAKVWAVYDVESTGRPFIGGRPAILFEPHRFSRATGHRFDVSHPHISSRRWNRALYPASQLGRYEQLLDAVGLDVDAGFASASYGGFQILGENYELCGAATPWAFAWRQAQTEADQLDAFVSFVERRGLAAALRRGDWAAFAKGYNGTAYRENRYDDRLAAAYRRRAAHG